MQYFLFFVFYPFILRSIVCEQRKDFKTEICSSLICNNSVISSVCGIREENEGVRFRIFENECALLEYGCKVKDEEAYGIVNLDYCKQSLLDVRISTNNPEKESDTPCVEFDCSYPSDAGKVCGIKEENNGYKVRLFANKCQLVKFNCVNKTNFTTTDLFYCNGVDVQKPIEVNRKIPNIFIVDANMYNFNNNINDTIDNFFAATHFYNIPVDELNKHVNDSARRMLINVFGPQVIFKPWTVIPKNISEDRMHEPTLGSCFHRCPKRCPDTYAPVCGQPGVIALEPSLMFKNHCFMDAAQCKMRWDDKSPTAESSTYIEANFLFCLGDTMNTLYRFLPLVRTLQHMGRLKKRGHFRYRVRNLRFLNNMLMRDIRIQG